MLVRGNTHIDDRTLSASLTEPTNESKEQVSGASSPVSPLQADLQNSDLQHSYRRENTRATSTGESASPPRSFQDAKVDVKIVLSGLWVAMLFVFAFVDIFGFWRADVINGALDKRSRVRASRSTSRFSHSARSTS